MSRLDLYDITFEWSNEFETSFLCSAHNLQTALTESSQSDTRIHGA